MRAGAEIVEGDGRQRGERRVVDDGDFRAERAAVELPFVGRPTPLLRRGRAPVEGAAEAEGERGRGDGARAHRLAADGDAVRIQATEVAPAKRRAEGGRAGPELKRLAELGGGDVGDGRAGEHAEVEFRINVLIPAAGAGPLVGRAFEFHG